MRSPAYGKLPITWVINPALIDLAPRLYQWYLDRLGSQELAAMMGDGVPGSDRSAGFKAFCDMTRDYLERSGILSLKVMGESEAAAWNIQPYVLNSGYAGPPDLRGIGHYEYHIDGNTFHIGNVNLTSDWRLFEIENLRKVIRQGPAGQPLFLNVFCGTCGGDIFSGPDQRDTPAMIQAVAESLQASEQADGKRYFFARSMDVAATYRKWQNLPV